MSDVAADIEALQAFVEATNRWLRRLVEGRDELSAQRMALTSMLPHSLNQPGIGDLDDVITRWEQTAALVEEVRADLVTADGRHLPGGHGGIRLGLELATGWTSGDTRRLVHLGRRRAALRRELESGRPGAVDISRRLQVVDAEMARLSSLMDAGGWTEVAYLRAGVERGWNPADGLLDNDANVRGIYRFYGDLHLEDPDLLWAGLAGLVGRQLYAGWQDLYTARHLLDEGSRYKYLLELADIPTGPDEIYDAINLVADVTGGGSGPLSLFQSVAAEDLEWLETKMLSMAKEIFDDVGWVHMAYHYGGIDAVEGALPAAHRWDVRAMFRMIDSGDPDRVWQAAEAMIVREQRDTIQDDWNEISGRHGPVGGAITEFLTWTADTPVPGAHPYREVLSESTGVAVPTFEVPEIDSPRDLVEPWSWMEYREIQGPKGNIANYADRKLWIDRDIGPAFHRLATEHPDRLEALLRSPFDARVSEDRLHPLPYPGD